MRNEKQNDQVRIIDIYERIEWHKISGMRNRLIHEYHKVNYNIFWEVLSEEIPGLENQIEKVLEAEKIDLNSIYARKWNFNSETIKEKLEVFFKGKPVSEIYQYNNPTSDIEDLNLYILFDENNNIRLEIYARMEQLTKTLQRKVILTTEGVLFNSSFKKEWLDSKELIYKK